jgi:hypothetical protein
MPPPELLVYLATGIFLLAGVLLVLGGSALRRRLPSRPRRSKHAPLETTCSVCRKPLIFERGELRPLRGEEVGLVVRSHPDIVGRKLGEYTCPYCEAAHCFFIDVRPPQWLGANYAQPQTTSGHCQECRKPLRKPPWPEHAFDGRLQEAPQLAPDLGLICSRCHAVCCVSCCKDATRNRTPDGSFLCPRCFRGPVEAVFHP